MRAKIKMSHKVHKIFIILDDKDEPISVAGSEVEVRRQIAWFLPKNVSYHTQTICMVEEIDETSNV